MTVRKSSAMGYVRPDSPAPSPVTTPAPGGGDLVRGWSDVYRNGV